MKYELTDEIIECDGRKLHRIRALKDIVTSSGKIVNKGDLGGWIAYESNLSQGDNSWVDDNACVYDYAWIDDNAYVCDNAHVYGKSRVHDEAIIKDNAHVRGEARVFDKARICDNAQISGIACVHGNAEVSGRAIVHGEAVVLDEARIFENSTVSDNACVYDNAQIYGNSKVYGEAEVYNQAEVYDNAELLGEACIGDSSCYITIKGLGKNYENTTVFTTKNKNIAVKDNYYYYKTLSEFANQMEEIFGDSKYAKEYLTLVELAKIHFGIEEE